MKKSCGVVLLALAAVASMDAGAYARADWFGSWKGESGADFVIDEFDGAAVIVGAGAKFAWKGATLNYEWLLGDQCTKSALSKDGSKIMFRTEGCNNAEFNGKTAICTLKTPTDVECTGEFGVRTWSKNP